MEDASTLPAPTHGVCVLSVLFYLPCSGGGLGKFGLHFLDRSPHQGGN